MNFKQALVVSAEVRAIVGDPDLERLAALAGDGYRCTSCGQRGSTADGPASVVIIVKPDPPALAPVGVVQLAHNQCSASRVVQSPEALNAPAEVRMAATAALLPSADGLRAVLITELLAPVVQVTGPGERRDLATSALLGMGLHMLATPWDRAPDASGWLVRLSSRAALVTDPAGDCYYEGPLQQPQPWHQLVARRGTVELLAGTAGIGAAAPGRPEPGLAALDEAARVGRLVGATVPALVT